MFEGKVEGKVEADIGNEVEDKVEANIGDEIEDGVGSRVEADGGSDGDGLSVEEMDEDALRLAYGELRGLYLRALAEQRNLVGRRSREEAHARRFAGLGLARDLLEVDDNLLRALGAMADGEAKEGVGLVARGLREVLLRHGVVPFESVGERLDPHYHEALAEVESVLPAGSVVEVVQGGWMIHDKLLRAARVLVSRRGQERVERVESEESEKSEEQGIEEQSREREDD
ncbi:MAG: nucleotide exchange factor GrpE [Alphaproteobacteria bacterium]